jgi:glycosyltransferase 2 family protein
VRGTDPAERTLDPPSDAGDGEGEGDTALASVELFDPPRPRRTFSPGDLLRLLIGVGLIGVGAVVGRIARSTIRGVEFDLLQLVGRLPDPVDDVLVAVAQFVTRVIPTVALVMLLAARRWRVALLLILAGWLADFAMSGVDVLLFDRTLSELVDAIRETTPGDRSPSSHVVASTTAIVTVAAPWLGRRWRRALWWSVGLVVLIRLLSVAQPAFDVIAALGVGIVVGSAVLLVFGSPTREPHPTELLDGITATGLTPRRIEQLPASGSALRYRVVEVVDGTERHREITLRTPDERDADLLNRTVRRLRFAESEVDLGYRRVERRIEHEALVLVLAERHGVRAPRLVALGGTEQGAAFLVTDAVDERPVSEDDLRSPTFLDELWRLVGDLHAAGVAHRRLDLDAVRVDPDGRPRLGAFHDAHVAPSPRERARDVAELLTETAIAIGPQAAVGAAVSALGADPVATSLRMLQPLALPSTTRARAKAAGELLDELRAEVSRATGEPDIELDRLERIRPRTLLIIVASTLAFYSLLPQLANIGDTVESFSDARPLWLLGAALASVSTYLFAAISFQGAIAQPIPFAANLRSQWASSFAGLVGPAGAGGYALNLRFLQRNGLRPAEAAASVTINGLAGFAMHAVLMIGFITWSGRSGSANGSSGLGGMSLPAGSTILGILAIVLALVGVGLAIGPVRTRVTRPLVGAARTGGAQIAVVFRRPLRVLGLFGGSTGISLSYVVAIACAVQAFGGGLTLAQIGTAYLLAVAIATLAPTPGGLGALEAALIAGLTGFGLASGPAVAAVLSFRLLTFWLPILPGWFAAAWMQRNDEL